MTNERIAQVLDQMADCLEFQGANPFRVRAYRNGARVMRDYPESLAGIVEAGTPSLTEIDGIGNDLAEKITTLVRTGELPQLAELLEQIPENVLAMLRVPGLGPRKAALLHRELGIDSLERLRAACEAGEVSGLKGFGKRTERAILDGISVAENVNQRIRWDQADRIAQTIRMHLESCPSVERLEFAGSYRRGKETVGDLDVLVVSSDAKQVMDHFAELPDVAGTLGRGETKMSIRLQSGLQVDLRAVADQSFGAALQYFTGSKDHNVVLRGLAKQRGLKINEYGVYDVSSKSEKYIAGRTEDEVYEALELPTFRPETREARREFEWAEQGDLPRLIELGDLRGDLHMHTTATDGKATLEEMVAAAQQRGLKYIAITDHSPRVRMAGGLDASRLRDQWKQIDQLNEQLDGQFFVLKGIECDILEKGGMDLPEDVLSEADWVLASVHYGQRQTRRQLTDRVLGALEHPYVSALAHPTGRIINRRNPSELDTEEVFQAAKENGKLLELNASPRRLDLNDIHCAAAKKHGVPIVINTDAHSIKGLADLRYGVLQARRAGLTKADVANARTYRQFLKLLTG